MFRWLKKKRSRNEGPNELIFKGPDEAFEYAMNYLSRPLEQGVYLVGQVLGKGGIKVGDFDVKGDYYNVRLATDDGAVEVSNCGTSLDTITPVGNLVMVEAASYNPELQPNHHLNYYVIVAQLEPVLVVSRNYFKIVVP